MVFFLILVLWAKAIIFATPVYAQAPAALKCGDPGAPACISGIVGILRNIISLLAPIAAIAFLIMFIVGGFQFVTSGGDPKAAGHARATLTFAIIGIILVVASWLILLLIKGITGVDVTTVEFPTTP